MANESDYDIPPKSNGLIHVPKTASEMLPPRAADAVTEAARLLREHAEELYPYWGAIAGEEPTLHGSLRFDEASCAFEVKRIAKEKGFLLLKGMATSKLWTTLRFAYKRNTGHTVKLLEKQQSRLRLEHKLPTNEPVAEAAE